MATCKYPKLTSPIKIGSLILRNRIIAAPTGSPCISPPDYIKPESAAFWELRAKGGAAVVTLGDNIVDSETGLMHPHKMRIDDPAIIPSLTDAARYISQHGAIASLELQHGGKFSNVENMVTSDVDESLPTYGPDPGVAPNGKEILEMPKEIIERICRKFGEGAAIAKKCGFGMVCVHGAHGWLLHQFLSPSMNHREDEYGGSPENRARFAIEALKCIRAATGKAFPIEFRMSGAEFTDGGYGIEEGIKIARLVAPYVDLLHVSAGVHDDEDTCGITHPDMFRAHGCNVWLAEAIKKEVDVPVACIGGLNDPEQMEEIIGSGKADIIEMSRALMADPYLPKKIEEGEDDKIVRCVRCLLCHDQTSTTRNIRCTVNPVIGREVEHRNKFPDTEAKKVLVAGGGPGGLYAALTAAKRGHRVILCEKESVTGGMLRYERNVPFKKDLYDYSLQLERRAIEAGTEIRTGTEVTREYAEELSPDVLICAVGADYIVPPIPGKDKEIVKFLPALLDKGDPWGERVVILGGGLVGCESAIHLTHLGKKVTIVEMKESLAQDAPMVHRQGIMIELRKGIKAFTKTRAVEITEKGLLTADEDGKELFIDADSVFCAAGLRSRESVRLGLHNAAPRVISIGDCIRPGTVFNAVSQGYYCALDI